MGRCGHYVCVVIRTGFCTLIISIFGIASVLHAAVYQVGPGRDYKALQAVVGLLKPGDTIELDGGASYAGGVAFAANGAPGHPIVVRGRPVDGRRPVIAGTSIDKGAVIRVNGSHYLFENLELVGDARTARGFYNVGDDVTLSRSSVHDCPFNGISGSDASGSFTLDHVEVFHCGHGSDTHQIYVGSNNAAYPHAVFRMQFCYVHDGRGGNNVKSRVTRNELRYNWIEGAYFHELDLIGPDPKDQKPGSFVNSDAEVVGNVLIKRAGSHATVARLGSDGTGSSLGHYRFINNTIFGERGWNEPKGMIWPWGPIRSLEMFNNVFDHDGAPLHVIAGGATDRSITSLVAKGLGHDLVSAGACNWLPAGSSKSNPQSTESRWSRTMTGPDPGFRNPSANDFTPAGGSPLIGKARVPAAAASGEFFSDPLNAPEFDAVTPKTFFGDPVRREASDGALDIGAIHHSP